MSARYGIGKTLLSCFSQFKKEELCQLYIHTGAPDRETCQSYYRVTDKSVLKGVITRRVAGGTLKPVPLEKQPAIIANSFYKRTYGSKKNKQPNREFLRDVMWKISPWYNRALKQWIQEQQPTCLYVAIGSNKFLYDMALRIAKDFDLPICTYVCDDFYFAQAPQGFWGWLWKRTLDKKTRELMAATTQIVSICDEMSTLYGREFSRPAATVMTGTNYRISEPVFKESIHTLRYFGKTNLNRYQSLADIGRALDEINSEKGTDYSLEIFCDTPSPEARQALESSRSVQVFPFLVGEEFNERFFNSEALLHVEAFDLPTIDRVKHSVSTKIADSLASGIPLFAYAPAGIASVEHLIRHQGGIVATDKNQLKEKLCLLFENAICRKQSSERNVQIAKDYHDPQVVSRTIYSLLTSLSKEMCSESFTS